MISARLLRRSLIRLLPALLGALGCAQALPADDPPGRVARLNDGEGSVVHAAAGDNEWTEANYNRPLTRGDRLWTDKGSRAEIQVGSAAVRMDGQTHMEITGLDDQSAQLSVTQGNLYVHVRDLPDGENFEVDTPNLAFRAAYPGDYRIDVDAVRGTTRVTIHSGTGAVYGETGDAIPLGGGQQIMFRARDLNKVNTQESPPQDGFDRWAAERNRHEDQSPSARYVPREVVGYQQLDAHGQWQRDAELGWIWLPIVKGAEWAPYRAGHWEWIEPWGWTWMDDAPWGFAPFHYGRWTQVNSRWAWVPGRMGPHPVYAPALVAFVGSTEGKKGSVTWFPLAPGEPFQPGYAVSPLYISNVNRNIVLTANPDYRYQHKPEALTAISSDDFQRGKPLRAGWLRVAANMITQAQVVPPPPMPGRRVGDHPHAVQQARVTPPAAAEARQVVANATPAPGPAPARAASEAARPAVQAKAQTQQAQVPVPAAAKPLQAAAAQPQIAAQAAAKPASAPSLAAASPAQAVPAPAKAQAPAAPAHAVAPAPAVAVAPAAAPRAETQRIAQQKAAEQEQQRHVQAARVEQARAQEQARREHQTAQAAQVAQARRAEQAKADKRREASMKLAEASRREKARRSEQARHEQLLTKRAEQARREEQLRREQQARREQTIARRADQAKREAVAKRDEQQRREAHAQVVEQARRAADRDALAMSEQRAQREEQARRQEQVRRDEQARQELAQARRDTQEREIAQHAAQQRQQQALIEQWRRDHQVLDPQRERVRQRPDLRSMASPSS
jgi:hypothetical protein